MKSRMHRAVFAVVICFGLGTACLVTPQAQASTNVNANIAVSATIPASCTVSTSPLSFGTYSGTEIDLTDPMTVDCTQSTAYTIVQNGGSAGSCTGARMVGTVSGGTDVLPYEIYKDSGHTTVWCAGTSAITGTGTGGAQTVNVYGVLPAGGTLIPDTFTDNVQVTLTF